jgi:hypothetical protein
MRQRRIRLPPRPRDADRRPARPDPVPRLVERLEHRRLSGRDGSGAGSAAGLSARRSRRGQEQREHEANQDEDGRNEPGEAGCRDERVFDRLDGLRQRLEERRVSEAWAEGTFDVAAEHATSETIRRRLARFFDADGVGERVPTVIVGLPVGTAAWLTRTEPAPDSECRAAVNG